VFMGCSVGGQLAYDLCAHYPEEFSAAVAMNGWHHMELPEGFTNEFYHHPHIWQDYQAAFDYMVCTPYAPEGFRRETYWIYASGGPSVYRGDNDYFAYGHDLREDGHLIDTTRTPLYVVAGEYDMSSVAPSGARAILENIPGAKYVFMPQLGHFMHSDDPVRFCEQIMPVMDEILGVIKR
jgi:pimeloyl-ACP methyl ester carboxylesterase